MKHSTTFKYLALICILISALLTVCACNPTGDGTGDSTASDKNETTTAPKEDETTAPKEDETTAPIVEKEYKITVLDPNGAPFQSAFITCANDPTVMTFTDANGVATVTAKQSYTLNISAGSYGEITVTLASDTNVTVNLTVADDGKTDYKVKVVDQDGNAIEGVKVQLCIGELCQLPQNTDASGVATVRAEEDDYTVKITKDGYTGEASYTFPAGETEMTVTLTKN